MGLDLTICPIRYGDRDNWEWWLTHERLGLDRDYYFFERIMPRGRQDPDEAIEPATDPKLVPEGARVQWYGDEGLEEVTTDAYGDPLKFVYAEEFENIDPEEIINEWNKAVLIFLRSLPPKIPILLWWH